MLELKSSRWARDIIGLQNEDGNWGYFHTLSNPTKQNPLTTEQALRRLQILGYTLEDDPIKKAVNYLHDCLSGKAQIPDRREKLHNWDIFTSIMFSAWIRRFTLTDSLANETAEKWAEIVSSSFIEGTYNHDYYTKAYTKTFKLLPRGGRLVDFVSFYQVSLLNGVLDGEIEQAVFDYFLCHEAGIYYIYEGRLSELPEDFRSKRANRYISALELLSEYENVTCRKKLKFAAEWLYQNREQDGRWDMGTYVKDFVHFPLSDSWRSSESRKCDCTYRISKLLERIGS
ncbi:MAG TPA: hypothetical protein VN549_02190 [Negativicutes bacterium]|nr:hypothetical protein [Negativicutes bacterium]